MKVLSSKIDGTVIMPSSKSFLHRQLILACLSNCDTIIKVTGFGDDIIRTIDCLNKLGASIKVNENEIVVSPIKQVNTSASIDVGESGSTLRFLLSVVSCLGITITFNGSESIISRPISPILNLLKENGVSVSSDVLPVTISGKLKNNNFTIDGSLSSQFATGLLISLAKMGGGTLLIKNVTSVSYLDITAMCLKMFSINVSKKQIDNDILFTVYSGEIISPKIITCEGDYSSACFMLALGVMCGKVVVKNLNKNSCQGDKIFVDILKKMGADITVNDDQIIAKKSALKPINVSVKNCPDIAPILSVVMAFSNGESTITDTDRLKIKESNRLDNIISMLQALNIKAVKLNNQIKITGGKLKSASLNSYNDHRMAISSIVALTSVGGTIDDTKCINKSYPEFLKDYAKVGGKYEA